MKRNLETRIKLLEAKTKPRKKLLTYMVIGRDETPESAREKIVRNGEQHLYAKKIYFVCMPAKKATLEEWSRGPVN